MPAKVLVADDSPTIRRRATTTLSEAGYEVTCVEDGQAAWGLLQGPESFSVLLCDILMPGLDGYELCRRVKSDARLSSLPVLLLRGTFEPWDQGKAVDAGADGYVTKPFDAEALLSTLGEVLADTGGAALPVAAAAPPTPAPAPPVATRPEPLPTPVAAEEDPFGAAAPVEPSAPEAVAADPFGAEAEPSPADTAVFDPGPSTTAEPAPAMSVAAPLDLGDDSPFGSAEPVAMPADPLADLAVEPAAPAPAPVPPEAEPWAPVEREPVAPPAPAPPPPVLPAEPVAAVAPILAARPEPVAPAAAIASAPGFVLDDAAIERIAERVAARLTGRELERLAWEVVPDVAEALIRKRLSEIEAQLGEE